MDPDPQAISQRDDVEVSIVIPSYNHALYIEAAVDSVLAQTFSRWELIIVDDGSTDDSRAVLERRYGGDPRIELIFQSNMGAHQAINRAMSCARGRYISILNSDDIYHPDRLQVLWDFFHDHEPDLIFTPVQPMDGWGNPLPLEHPWTRFYERLMRAYTLEGARQALLTGNFAVTTSNFFFRAELIKDTGGFTKLRYNHDWDFLSRLVRRGKKIICVGDRPLLFYRIHDRNTISQNTLMARVELKRILQKLAIPEDAYHTRLIQQIQLNLRSVRREQCARREAILRETYESHIQGLQDQLAQQGLKTAQLEMHLKLIEASRAYRLSRVLSKVWSQAFRLMGKRKNDH